MKNILLLFFTFISFSLMAQVDNYALKLDGSTTCQVPTISELNVASQFTIQAWIKPVVWVSNATVFSQTDHAQNGISLQLGNQTDQELILNVSNGPTTSISFKNTGVKINEWHQVTVVYNGAVSQKIVVYVDNVALPLANTATIPSITASTNAIAQIGALFNGSIDELRIWSTALSSTDFYWQNTINQYHPQYDNLAAYWKFDQNLCSNIYDYKKSHHGITMNVIRQKVTDNARFRYLGVSGYTSFRRFSDRSQVGPEMYRMTNDLIILSMRALNNGTPFFADGPDCNGSLQSVNHLTSFGERNGVLQFNGAGSKMDVGANTLMVSPTNAALTTTTFEAWIYIDQWVEGAYLFKKEASATSRYNILLGSETTKELIVQYNGYTYSSTGNLKTGVWQHVAVSTNKSGPTNQSKFYFFYNGVASTATNYPTSGTVSMSIPLLPSTTTTIGENFNGKMDEILLWRTERSSSITSDMNNGVPLPAAGKNIGAQVMIDINAYWKADDASNPGLDSYAWQNLFNIMRDYYKGYRGFTIRIGVIADAGWETMISSAANRTKLAQGIVAAMQYTDGADLDFEWAYTNTTSWTNYALLVQEIRSLIGTSKVLTVSLHPVSYQLTQSYLSIPDYYTFQNYGPQTSTFAYSGSSSAYTNSAQNFVNWGFDTRKIRMSVANLATNGSTVVGYKDVIGTVNPYSSAANTSTYNGSTYTFTGVDMVKTRAQYVLDQQFGGIMYFDMGNDLTTSDSRSLVRAINTIIASNVDTLVTSAVQTGIKRISMNVNAPFTVVLDTNPVHSELSFTINSHLSHNYQVKLIDMSGREIKGFSTTDTSLKINVTDMKSGLYLLKIESDDYFFIEKVLLTK